MGTILISSNLTCDDAGHQERDQERRLEELEMEVVARCVPEWCILRAVWLRLLCPTLLRSSVLRCGRWFQSSCVDFQCRSSPVHRRQSMLRVFDLIRDLCNDRLTCVFGPWLVSLSDPKCCLKASWERSVILSKLDFMHGGTNCDVHFWHQTLLIVQRGNVKKDFPRSTYDETSMF